jgi:ATP-dependent helicase/nuclease subunit B
MKFYYIETEYNYLSAISRWLISNYQGRLDKVKIFLPNGLMCQFLSKLLIEELELETATAHFFLPSLIPLSNLSDHVLAVNSNDQTHTQAQKLEQTLTLAQIISSKEQLGIVDSIDMARQLNTNFEELISADCNLHDVVIENLHDKSIYIQQQIQSLEFYYQEFSQALKKKGKLAHYNFFAEAINSYKLEGPTIFVGVTHKHKAFEKFLIKHRDKDNVAFILPPLNVSYLSDFADSNDLLSKLKVKKENLEPIAKADSFRFLLSDFIDSNQGQGNIPNFNHISVIEADNEIEESNLILLLVKEFIDQNPQSSVAIINPNHTLSKLIVNNLNKYAISFSDFIGLALINSKLSQFILHIADYLLDYHNIEKLLLCLKHPFIACEYSLLLEKFIRKQKFLSDTDQVIKYITNIPDAEMQTWWNNFFQPIYSYQHILTEESQNLKNLLKINLEIVQKIYPEIWYLDHGVNSINFFRDLLLASESVEYINKQEYVGFLKSLLKKTSALDTVHNRQVTLLSPENAKYLNFDLVILADMNENSWPNLRNSEIWLTNQLRSNLQLSNQDAELKGKIQDFYLLLCNKQVVITRSKKVNNALTIPSRLLQKLLVLVDKHKLESLYSKNQYLEFLRYHLSSANTLSNQDKLLVNRQDFPVSISVTSLELLIRNPYGFFARNILKLYPVKELSLESMNAEFGVMIHKIISMYNSSSKDFLDIAEQELEDSSVNEFIKNLWWPKICSIAKAYTTFDQNRRENIKSIHSEIHGEMLMKIEGKEYKVTAIADEIIVTKDNKAYILDYKTGTVPSAKDVLSGLAPQLIVEGLILQNGGFKGLPKHTPSQVVFIKLSSSDPFLSEISLNDIDFELHYGGLKNLLLHYIAADSSYPPSPNKNYSPKYDDYKHLGRKYD